MTKKHIFQNVADRPYAFPSYRCQGCGAYQIGIGPHSTYHYPSWRDVSEDCDEAKKQIRIIELLS